MNSDYYTILNGLLAGGMNGDDAIIEAKRLQAKIESKPIVPEKPETKPTPPLVIPPVDTEDDGPYYFLNKDYFTDSNDFYLTVSCERSVRDGRVNLVAQGGRIQYAMITGYPMHCLDDTIEEIIWRVNKPDSGLYMTYGKMHVTRVGFTYGTKRVELWTSNGTYDFGLKQMDVRPGDVLKMVINRRFCCIEVNVYNQTTLAKVNYTYDYDMSKTSGAIMPDTYYRQLYFGPMATDDIEIVSVKMGIRDTNPDILCIGDSITAGYNGGTDRYAAILDQSNLTTVAGGPSDGTANCEMSCATLLPVMKPANIILAIGVNDGAGINREKYTNIVNMCVATGANVRLMLMANDVRDQTDDYNWICQQWPTLVMTDVWTTTLRPGSTTGQVKPEYKSDANHYNRLGHIAIANAINNYI